MTHNLDNSDNTSINNNDPLHKLRSWQRYHFRLTSLYGGAILATLSVLGINFYQFGVDNEVKNLQKRLLSIATSLAASVDSEAVEAIPLDNNIKSPLHDQLYARFKTIADLDTDTETIYLLRPTNEPTKLRFFIDYAKDSNNGQPGELYDATEVPIMLKGFDHPVAENEPYADAFGLTLSGYAPVVNKEGRSIAIVGVDVTISQLAAIKNNVLTVVAVAFGIALLLLGSVAWLVARNIRTPLTQIIDAAAAISQGKLNTRVNIRRNDELGVMSHHINLMAEQLQEREFIRETFGRYVSEDVAKALLNQDTTQTLVGEERVVTILFCDMRGYSTVSEQMPPQQIVDMLNRYLSTMTEIVDNHGGCIIEFIGDAVLAVFGAPHYLAEHAEKATRCAIQMRSRLNLLNKELHEAGITRYWKADTIHGIGTRVGIHTGHVVAGNLGSSTRMKYSVIGDTVNVAARLEVLNKELGTDILVSRDVYLQLPEDLTKVLHSHGEHNIKGREQPVTVYSIKKDSPKLALLKTEKVSAE